MFHNFFKRDTFYFSEQYDLTRTLIDQAEANFEGVTVDSRFFYNQSYTEDFSRGGFNEFVQPFINGLLEDK